MAEKRDYYEVLGIDCNALASEPKKKPTENPQVKISSRYELYR